MKFKKIDRETWERREYFEHYLEEVPCTYSMTVRIDVSRIREKGYRFYPAMLYCLAAAVNRMEEFRTAFRAEGELGIYDTMSPCYTIFHKDTHTFSLLWTEFQDSLSAFCEKYEEDLKTYGAVHKMTAKEGIPENTFSVSAIPWTSFEGFHLHLPKSSNYLLPVFTMGKYVLENGRWMMPLAVQVHHAVCDGFHVSRFISELQQLIDAQ